jgi:ATP-dependent DNA ligase
VKSVILDGEICAWHKLYHRIVQKSDKNDIRNIKADNEKYQQCLVLYDICYLNGKVLTALPLKVK